MSSLECKPSFLVLRSPWGKSSTKIIFLPLSLLIYFSPWEKEWIIWFSKFERRNWESLPWPLLRFHILEPSCPWIFTFCAKQLSSWNNGWVNKSSRVEVLPQPLACRYRATTSIFALPVLLIVGSDFFFYWSIVALGFPGSSKGKESASQCRRCRFDLWVGKIPWRRAWKPTAVFLPGESPWTEEPRGLQSIWLQRVAHNWSNLAYMDKWHCEH